MGFPQHSLSASELASVLEAERKGEAFLTYRDGVGDLRLGSLEGATRLTLVRGEHNDLEFGDDESVAISDASGGRHNVSEKSGSHDK